MPCSLQGVSISVLKVSAGGGLALRQRLLPEIFDLSDHANGNGRARGSQTVQCPATVPRLAAVQWMVQTT